jgi:hypothetical protein
MKWVQRAILAFVLPCVAVSLGALAAGARLPVGLQVAWVVFATVSALTKYSIERQNVRLHARVRELSDLLTRLLTDDVDAR